MLSFQHFKNKNTIFNKLYDDAYEYGFSSEDTEKKYYSQIHKINRVLKPVSHNSISQCYMFIDVNKVLYTNNNDYFDNINVEYIETSTNKDIVFTYNLFWYISEAMERNETISIGVSLNNYLYDEDEKEYSIHSVIILLHPSKTNTSKKKDYNMFWINSHGGALNYTNFHYKKLSSKRKIKKQFYKPIDYIIAEQLTSSFKKFTEKYRIKNLNINYKADNEHNYLTGNLQYYDTRGCCFIYPILFNLILHTNFNKYFINEHLNKVKAESTASSLLEEKNIELFVYQCLSQIDNRISKYIIEYYETNDDEKLDDNIEYHLNKYKEKLIKNVLIKTMGFIKQTYWSVALFNLK